jgi:hypothetical protein
MCETFGALFFNPRTYKEKFGWSQECFLSQPVMNIRRTDSQERLSQYPPHMINPLKDSDVGKDKHYP